MDIVTCTSPLLDSNMYILLENNHAIIIDPYEVNTKTINLMKKNNTVVDYIVLTHEHYDHISGVNTLSEVFKCQVFCSRSCADRISDSRLNLSRHFQALCIIQNGKRREEAPKVEPYTCFADCTFSGYHKLFWEGHTIELVETPGHTEGSICIQLNKRILFSGDTLILGVKTETRNYKNGYRDLENVSKPFLNSLLPDTVVYPGHGLSFLIKEHQLYGFGELITKKILNHGGLHK